MTENKYQCPSCPCFFFSEYDLKRHREAFSFYEDAHRKNWQREMERREKYE